MSTYERRHSNGWAAIVDERLDGDQLVAYAIDPKGEPYYTAANCFEGGEEDYEDRLRRAREAADHLVDMGTGH